jgi:endonuclease-3
MLVGFGQEVCKPVGPRCDLCDLGAAKLCPSRRTVVPPSPRKQKVKVEVELEVKEEGKPKVEIGIEVKEETTENSFVKEEEKIKLEVI